jgi:hypothetical protein
MSDEDTISNLKTTPRVNNTFLLNTNVDSSSSVTASKRPVKPFIIYLGEAGTTETGESLTLLINPKDLTLGSSHVINNSYTRNGWLVGMWGKQQSTMAASGVTAAFYSDSEGLTVKSRRQSVGYLNFVGLLSFFKNNGYNFISGVGEQGEATTSRVINVIDTLKVSYDGTIYEGSFNTLTFEDSSETPYNFGYSFEFVISGLLGDIVDGHLANDGNRNSAIRTGIQGSNLSFIDVAEVTEKGLENLKDTFEVRSRQDALDSLNLNSPKSENKEGNKFLTPTDTDKKAINDLAKELGVDPDWILATIAYESGGTFNPKKSNEAGSSAKGLIQFVDSTARDLGFKNSQDLVDKYPTIESQIRGPVRDYFRKINGYKPYAGKNQQYFALSVFFPRYKDASLDTPMMYDNPDSQAKFLKQNPGLVKDGQITVGAYYGSLKKAQDAAAKKSTQKSLAVR